MTAEIPGELLVRAAAGDRERGAPPSCAATPPLPEPLWQAQGGAVCGQDPRPNPSEVLHPKLIADPQREERGGDPQHELQDEARERAESALPFGFDGDDPETTSGRSHSLLARRLVELHRMADFRKVRTALV